MHETSCEVIIVGSGITGLTIANELMSRGIDDIIIIDKEDRPGRHASGRNSGVLHSGIYYASGTLKAHFCVEGNRLLKKFCENNKLSILQNGKVIVVSNEHRLANLYELKERADNAGAISQIIDSDELKTIEPYAYSYEKALYCPETAVFKPIEVLDKFREILNLSGKVRFFYNTEFDDLISGNRIRCDRLTIKFNKFVNASGAYSEKVATIFGFNHKYKVLPFKGTYKKLTEKSNHLVNSNIYPVPDLNNPFLGVHFTKSAHGEVYAGPTAIPALSRENYGIFKNLDYETLPILLRNLNMLLVNDSFRSSALNEIKKYNDHFFWKEATELIPSIDKNDLINSNKVGIRPQLVDWESKKFEMDFVILQDTDSIHILNAISPGFTTSMPFAAHVVDRIYGDEIKLDSKLDTVVHKTT